MKEIKAFSYSDIDWLQLWVNEREMKSWKSKGAKEWDKKAVSFSERTLHSPYVPLLLSRLPLMKKTTVLDVGCGPGSLALPIAEQTAHVTAIDYSSKMLDILKSIGEKREINNISTIHCSWEDDWEKAGIKPADIALASRSMNVENLPQAIDKLQSYAKQYVFITDRISPSPFDPDAFEAIGRTFKSGPDYIYTLNMLYSKNIHPHVEVLSLSKDVSFESMDYAYSSYSWMFKELTENEQSDLLEYVKSIAVVSSNGEVTLKRRHIPRWAMIWWQKETGSPL